FVIRRGNGAALRVETLGPRLLCVRFAGDEFAGGTVEDVIKSVAVRHGNEFAFCAADLRVKKHWHVCDAPIMRVVRRELEIPPQLSGRGIESNKRTGVKIVAGAHVTIPIGTRIADAPVDEL